MTSPEGRKAMQNGVIGLAVVAGLAATTSLVQAADDLRDQFREPPSSLRPMPLWHLNGTLTPEEIVAQMTHARDDSGFGGFAVLPVSHIETTPGTEPPYLSEAYFERYGLILDTAARLGMKIVFYDDIDFPSGLAGGRLAARYPEHLAKRLDKTEKEVTGPTVYTETLPATGTVMGVVAMNNTTKARIDLTGSIRGKTLRWEVPGGSWKVMTFTCVPGSPNLVDFLSPKAVDRFFSLTYDEYYRRFPQHFGTTIPMTYFDDISMMHVDGYRMWTPAYNTEFRKRRGFDPVTYYPALWYDIGPETTAARTALFGFRAELFSNGYVRKASDWAKAHGNGGLRSSGHVQGPYEIQPVDLSGDAIKAYEHTDIPMMDSIHYYGHGRPGFKITGSAAYNYDKPLVAVEIYGNYSDASVDANMLYRSAMELFQSGGNVLLPHGTWYDPTHVRIPPEISWRNPRLAPELSNYSRFVARAQLLLQGGRHVADIGMLYPIASLQGFYSFDNPDNKRFGLYAPPETDYLDLSERLTRTVRRDFTILHPEVLNKKCEVKGATLNLKNKVNHEQYRVFLLPGGDVISWRNLKKIKAFYDAGGKVVATTHLPTRSTEFGHDADVHQTIREMFGEPSAALLPEPEGDDQSQPFRIHTNDKDGAAYFIEHPNTATLRAVLDNVLPVPDVRFEGNPRVDSGNGMLTYLHKVKDGRDIYLIANSSNDPIDGYVRLRGRLTLEVWDPHTGQISPAQEVTHLTEGGETVARMHLHLPAARCVFLVAGGHL